MKTKFTLFFLGLAFLLGTVGCQGNGGTETGTTNGTVVVQGTTSRAEVAGLHLSKNQETGEVLGPVDAFFVRTYRVSFATEEDPQEAEANGSWQDILDETGDTSDCVASTDFDTYDVSNFDDYGSGLVEVARSEVPAGTYRSMRVTLCDHLPWSSSDPDVAASCPSSSAVMDIYPGGGTDGIATVGTDYFSTSGTAGNHEPSITTPGLLEEALTVTEGDTTTLTVIFSNSDDGNGFFVSEMGEGCGVSPPSISFE